MNKSIINTKSKSVKVNNFTDFDFGNYYFSKIVAIAIKFHNHCTFLFTIPIISINIISNFVIYLENTQILTFILKIPDRCDIMLHQEGNYHEKINKHNFYYHFGYLHIHDKYFCYE